MVANPLMRFDFAQRIRIETFRPVIFCLRRAGYGAKKNGELLSLMEGRWDVLLTNDRNIQYHPVSHSWPRVVTDSFNPAGRHSSIKTLISRNVPKRAP